MIDRELNRAYLVLGAESSGTRLVTRLLIAGGCHGDGGHQQPFDAWRSANNPFDQMSPIVWRRSYPWTSCQLWPNLGLDLLMPLQKHGYKVERVLVTTRNWLSISRSQVDESNRHAKTQNDALQNVQIAYREIFTQLALLDLPFLTVSYEAIVVYGERAIRPLLKELRLNDQATIEPISGENDDRRYPRFDAL